MSERNGAPAPPVVLAFLSPECPLCRKQDRILELVSRKHKVVEYDYWKHAVERELCRVDRHPTYVIELDGVELYRCHDASELL